MVASEPSIALSGRARFFLDVPGRPGMSGSPVYVMGRGFSVSSQAYEAFNDPGRSHSDKFEALSTEDIDSMGDMKVTLRFVGVYSGSLGRSNEPMREMGLGFTWLGSLVDQLVHEGVRGTNPFPPDP